MTNSTNSDNLKELENLMKGSLVDVGILFQREQIVNEFKKLLINEYYKCITKSLTSKDDETSLVYLKIARHLDSMYKEFSEGYTSYITNGERNIDK